MNGWKNMMLQEIHFWSKDTHWKWGDGKSSCKWNEKKAGKALLTLDKIDL